MMKKLLWCGAFLFMGLTVNGQTVDLNPDKDNAIYSENENSSGLGKLYVGETCTDNSRRSLLHFDIDGMLPPGAVVTDVTLTLNCDNVSPSAGSDDHSLHVVTQDWGEGTSTGGGAGSAAVAPDATWLDAMFGTDAWTTAGGDFNPTASATTTLPNTTGDFTWSSATMVTDVQGWLADPSSNYGWILVGEEAVTCTARRFGSKDEGTAPVLSITYTCTGGDPLAVCQNLTVYLDGAGEATISDADLDGGSEAVCGGGLTFSASQTTFTCDDIFDGPVPPGLVISAVYDCPLPGGLPKGVELYVINDIPDLSIYGLGSANNGGGTDGEEFTFPADAVAAGTYIYVSSEDVEFPNWFGFMPTYTSGSMLINGDDAVELFKDGSVIDVFGDIDVDGTGTAWEYLDGWARRVSDTGPDGATFTIGNWIFSGINVLDGETTNATAASPVPVGEFTTPPTTGVAITLTVTDEDLNTSTCAASVMVFDTLPPAIACIGDLTFILDETGTLSLDPSDIDAGTTDGCGIDVISLSETEFSCADEGEHVITLYATDIYGNIDSCTTTITIDASEVISIIGGVVTDATCNGFEDGTIDMTFEGGTPDFTFDWDNDGTGDFDDTEDLATLGAGAYVVIIEDANGCQASYSFEVGEPAAIEITTTVMDESCPGAGDGSIVIDAIEGGEGPYTGGDDLTELEAGTYSITINDVNGCSGVFDIEVGLIETIDLTITESGFDLTSNQDGASYQWVTCPEYNPIDGATDQTFTVTETGSYAVIVTLDAGCSDTTECVEFGFDGITESESLKVAIYPNPSSGMVNVVMDGLNGSAIVSVLDIKGSVLMSKTTGATIEQLDLTTVENGIYFVQVKSADSILTKKITVTK